VAFIVSHKYLSTTMASLEQTPMKRVLVFGGKTGWIGGKMAELLEKNGVSQQWKHVLCIRLIGKLFVQLSMQEDALDWEYADIEVAPHTPSGQHRFLMICDIGLFCIPICYLGVPCCPRGIEQI